MARTVCNDPMPHAAHVRWDRGTGLPLPPCYGVAECYACNHPDTAGLAHTRDEGIAGLASATRPPTPAALSDLLAAVLVLVNDPAINIDPKARAQVNEAWTLVYTQALPDDELLAAEARAWSRVNACAPLTFDSARETDTWRLLLAETRRRSRLTD